MTNKMYFLQLWETRVKFGESGDANDYTEKTEYIQEWPTYPWDICSGLEELAGKILSEIGRPDSWEDRHSVIYPRDERIDPETGESVRVEGMAGRYVVDNSAPLGGKLHVLSVDEFDEVVALIRAKACA